MTNEQLRAELLPCRLSKSERHSKHGHAQRKGTSKASPTYHSWLSMRSRCRLSGRDNSDRYYDKGVSICERWNSFENFLSDMGERPAGTTLDRIDSDDDKFLVTTHDLLSSFSEWADSIEPEFNGWISVEERLPDVEQGRSEMFLVCALSTAYKKQYVSAAHYLNKFELCPEDESFDTDDYGIEIVSGWFYYSIETENYSKVHESDLYKITHWMPLPPPPVVSAEMAQTTGD